MMDYINCISIANRKCNIFFIMSFSRPTISVVDTSSTSRQFGAVSVTRSRSTVNLRHPSHNIASIPPAIDVIRAPKRGYTEAGIHRNSSEETLLEVWEEIRLRRRSPVPSSPAEGKERVVDGSCRVRSSRFLFFSFFVLFFGIV